MSEHSPGPWAAHKEPLGDWIVEVAEGQERAYGNRVIAVIESRRVGEVEANARLISAAPDLLAWVIADEWNYNGDCRTCRGSKRNLCGDKHTGHYEDCAHAALIAEATGGAS